MKRSDMIVSNRLIFMEQYKALSLANSNIKCVVVANSIHSNTLMLSHFAPYVKKENITSLTRLDHNRAIAQISSKNGCKKD
jgi:malate/lactate dehydrogenase